MSWSLPSENSEFSVNRIQDDLVTQEGVIRLYFWCLKHQLDRSLGGTL